MRKSIISIILLVSISMLFVACGNSGPAKDSTEESFSQSIAEVGDNSANEWHKSECEEETVETEESPQEISDVQVFDVDIEDEAFEAFVRSKVTLSDNEMIEKTEWIEDQVCYRVAVERVTEIEGEYKHLADYIFVKEDTFKYVKVTYPSKFEAMDTDRYVYDACDFEVKYEDITFDGYKDIIISLGHQGAAGTCVSCAYVFENGDFVYAKSFELIPNYSINDTEKCIEGFYGNNTYKYQFVGGEFVE